MTEEDLSKFIRPPGELPPVEHKRQVKQIDAHYCSLEKCLKDVLKTHLKGGRFGRWTERDKLRLTAVLNGFRAAIIRLMAGEDISDDLHKAWQESRTIAQGAGFTGVKAVREILLQWLGSIFHSVDMKEWT